MRPKTIVLDIDGVIFFHHGTLSDQATCHMTLLPGVIEKLNEWDKKGYHIVLMTGRRESMRSITEDALTKAGVFYDQLVMGVTGGTRVLINDLKADSEEPTAVAVNVKRNVGMDGIYI